MVRKKRPVGWIVVIIIAVLVIVGILVFAKPAPQLQYRTAAVQRGDLVASVSASGVLQAPRTISIKSNVGGTIIKLAVDVGDIVHKGQLIARIDPTDSLTALQESQADLNGAKAKVHQSSVAETLQRLQDQANIQADEQAVETDRQRWVQAEEEAKMQPDLTKFAIDQAQSSLDDAKATLIQTENALVPQTLASAKSALDQAKANFVQANQNLVRQKTLIKDGFVPASQVETAQQTYDVCKAQLDSAGDTYATIKDQTDQQIKSAKAKVAVAQAAWDTAIKNKEQDILKQQDVAAALATLKQAKATLDSAKAGVYQEPMKKDDTLQSQASRDHTAWTVADNQKTLGYCTVLSPCDGIVVQKYAEEGTVVASGRNAIGGSGSGVSIVDVDDENHMEALVQVDESDIAQVRMHQRVKISVDAFPKEKFFGYVSKISPIGTVTSNVTTFPVTVVLKKTDSNLTPNMDTTCEFITSRKENVLFVPNEAVKETRRGATVMVMVNKKPVQRKVTIGIANDDNTEIVDGLKEGEVVVTATLSMKAGGAVGGQPRPGGSPQRMMFR